LVALIAATFVPDPICCPVQLPLETLFYTSHPSTVPGQVARFSSITQFLAAESPCPVVRPSSTLEQLLT